MPVLFTALSLGGCECSSLDLPAYCPSSHLLQLSKYIQSAHSHTEYICEKLHLLWKVLVAIIVIGTDWSSNQSAEPLSPPLLPRCTGSSIWVRFDEDETRRSRIDDL